MTTTKQLQAKFQRWQYRGITYTVTRGRDDRWHFYLHGDDSLMFDDCPTAMEAHSSAKSMIDGHLEDDR
jgi:hypothetical protein